MLRSGGWREDLTWVSRSLLMHQPLHTRACGHRRARPLRITARLSHHPHPIPVASPQALNPQIPLITNFSGPFIPGAIMEYVAQKNQVRACMRVHVLAARQTARPLPAPAPLPAPGQAGMDHPPPHNPITHTHTHARCRSSMPLCVHSTPTPIQSTTTPSDSMTLAGRRPPHTRAREPGSALHAGWAGPDWLLP